MTLWNCNSNDNIKNSNNSNDIHWDKISLLALMLYCYKVLSWVLKVFKLSLKSFLHFHIHLSVKAETTNIEVYQLSSTLKSDLCGVSCGERSENLQPGSRTLKALWQVQTSAAARSEEKKTTTTGETWSQNNHSRSAWMRAFWMSLWQACETAVTLSSSYVSWAKCSWHI